MPARHGLAVRIIAWVLGSAAVLAVPAAGVLGWVYAQAAQTNVGDLGFRNELAIPPLLEPTVGADGRKTFDLTLQAGRAELLAGTATQTWGINGDYLGPTLRAERGDDIRVNVTNTLDEPTSLHWHGMYLPAASDGGPHQPVEAGGDMVAHVDRRSARRKPVVPPAPARDHGGPCLSGAGRDVHPRRSVGRHARVAQHLRRRRHPLIVQDKRLRADGSLDFRGSPSSIGILGDETWSTAPTTRISR